MSSRTKLPPPDFMLGALPIHGDLLLAPMDGFSDHPFRTLCRRFGSCMSYTFFINAIDVVNGHPDVQHAVYFLDDERPVLFQLFDNDEDRILEAALQLEELQPDAIDINMGCSVRRVSRRGAGAGLLKDPVKIGRLMRRLSSRLSVPVTAKIRLGWDKEQLTYLPVSKAIEENGGALIAVHARTKVQAYEGKVNLDAIAEIKQNVSIPVLGNGDVRTIQDINRMKKQTGCDGIMIGRAAIGHPWIFSGRNPDDIPLEERFLILYDHLSSMIRYYGETFGVRKFRKHLVRYLDPLQPSGDVRRFLLTQNTAHDLLAAFSREGFPSPNTPLLPAETELD